MHPRPCLGPPDPMFGVRARSRRSRPNQVDYWECALQLLFNKLCLKMVDHGSRSTRVSEAVYIVRCLGCSQLVSTLSPIEPLQAIGTVRALLRPYSTRLDCHACIFVNILLFGLMFSLWELGSLHSLYLL
jgi:hypothetical protein